MCSISVRTEHWTNSRWKEATNTRLRRNVTTKMAAVLLYVVTICLIAQYNTAEAFDVTLLSSFHFVDDIEATQFLCRAPLETILQQDAPGETPPTRAIVREGGQGPGNPFIVSTSERRPVQGTPAYGARFHPNANDTRVGAFSCSVNQNGRTGKAVSFKLKDTAYVVPKAFTVRANLGEDATLEVIKTSSWPQNWTDDQIRWSKDGQELQGRQGLQLNISSVQTSHGGIYEAYREGERNTWNHAFSRLIVRACGAGKWGISHCSNTCPACYNGGVCDPETGTCICAPGFSGTNCNTACSAAHIFGPNCDQRCDFSTCRRKLLCPADPYGCICGPNYRGIRCDQSGCPAGTFGAGCAQRCNCLSGTCDSPSSGGCAGGCAAGWTGPTCQEPAPVGVTLVSSSHIVDAAPTEYQCRTVRGSIRNPLLQRKGGNGPGDPFAVDSTVLLENQGRTYGARFLAFAGNTRVGAFSCTVDSDGRTGTATSFKVKDTEAFTTTVSVGEAVTLRVTKTATWQAGWADNQVRWRRDGEMLDNRQGLQLTIPNVQTSHGGIYEAYRDGERDTWNHAFSRLIVRACPTNKWGSPDCRNRCPVCYNGGMCQAETGKCICAPGFRDYNCQSACPSNRFGPTCEENCGSSCASKLLCPADPLGCTCAPGYRGVRCDEACPAGTFGAGCTETCHCMGSCNSATGTCDQQGCTAGWSGPNCQVVSTNAVDFFASPEQNMVLNMYTAVTHVGVDDDAVCAKYCLQSTGLPKGFTCKSFDMFNSGGTVRCQLNTEKQNAEGQGSPGLTDNDGGRYYQREDMSSCSALPCANGATCLDGAEQQYTCICSPGWMGTNCDLASSTVLDYFAKYSGSNLVGNDAETIDGISREECATRCLQGTDTVTRGSCQSFDYRIQPTQRCYLSMATKDTQPGQFRQNNNDLEYYQREASGPCSNLPCQLPQRCRTAEGDSGYQCFCPSGRQGPNCDIEAQVDVGIESKGYLVDTGTVEMYCRTVQGNIIQNNISNVHYPFTREGRGNIGNPFTSSGTQKVYNYGVKLLPAAGNTRVGPFSCQVMEQGRSSKVTTLNIKKDATIIPTAVTQTASVGESVTLSVNTAAGVAESAELRWLRDGDLVTGTQTNSYTIDSVRLADVGVYEVFQPGTNYSDYNHAFMRLIVRGCPKDRWGPPECLGFCPVCQNGGVCDDNTGACVCAPGFRGDNCEKACPAGFFGQNCGLRCTFSNCREKLICLPHPYGCSCAAGFKGLDCNQECDAGTFGAGCGFTCNCQSGACSRDSGSCADAGGCKQGWSGQSCQTASNSPLDYFSEEPGMFLVNNPLSDTTNISLQECATRCVNSTTECRSFNYQPDSRQCWLRTKNKDDAGTQVLSQGGRNYHHREDFRACSRIPCLNGGACSVSRDSGTSGYTCTCAAGFTGSSCEQDVNECLTRNGLCDHNCTNTVGSYTCSCRGPNFLLAPDGRTCIDQTAPAMVQVQQTESECTVKWDPPPQPGSTIQMYQVSATPVLPLRDDDVSQDEFTEVTRNVTLNAGRTATFQKSSSTSLMTSELRELVPNSVYPFRVRARLESGWGGYSEAVNCTVPPLAVAFPPPSPQALAPEDGANTADSHRTIPIWLYGAKERYGTVGCYHVVVVELKNGAELSDLPAPEDLEVFSNYSLAEAAGRDYNAYVAAGYTGDQVGRRKKVILGDGQQTSCRVTQSSSGSRVKRATNQDVFDTTFTNQPLTPGTPHTTSVRAFSPQGNPAPTFSASPYMSQVATAPAVVPPGTGPGTSTPSPALWGKIAAGIIGGVLLVCALLPLCYFCWKKMGAGKKKASFDVEGRMKEPGVSARTDLPGVQGKVGMPGVQGKVDMQGVEAAPGLTLHPGAPPIKVKKPKGSAKTSCFGKKKKPSEGIEVYSPAINAGAGGELNAPNVNIRGPRGDIDYDSPHLEGGVDLSGPDARLKKPKKSGGLNCFKKPKKPTGGIEMDVPNVGGKLSGPDVDLKGDMSPPEMHVKGPQAPDFKLKGPKAPYVDMSGPKVPSVNLKSPNVDMEYENMDVDVKGPNVSGGIPGMNLKGPDLDADVDLPEAKGGFKMPGFNIGKPKMPDFNLKGPKVEGPDIDLETEMPRGSVDADIDLPDAKGGFKMPGFNIGKPKMPDFNLKGPKVEGPDVDVDANLPTADVDLPEAKGGFKMPDFSIGRPKMPDFNLKGPNVEGPDIDLETEMPRGSVDADLDLPEAKSGFKMPGFNIGKPKMPDFNLKGPKVEGPDIDADLDAEIPRGSVDADVDLPEAKSGFKMPGFNIGKPKMPDFNLKGPKVDGPDIDLETEIPRGSLDADLDLPEGNGGFKMPDFSIGRPKMPGFNLKGPKVDGPDIDAELPSGSIDAELDLPEAEAKGGFKMPDFNIGKPKMPDFSLKKPKLEGPDVDFDAELPSGSIDADVDLPKAKGGFEMPDLNFKKPDMPDFNLPSFKGPKVTGPDVDIDASLPSASIDADVDLPEARGGFNMPGMNLPKPSMPDLNLKGPKLPDVNVKGPKGKIRAPDIETELPRGGAEFNMQGPRVPDLHARGPSLDVKGPKAPSVAIKGPRVKGGIDAPKVDLKGKPADAAKTSCFGKKKPKADVGLDVKGPKLRTGDASLSMINPAFEADVPDQVIPWEGVRLDPKVLGRSGKFGEIRKGTVQKDGRTKPAVIKMLNASAPQKDRNDFISELDEMTRVGDHPNLVNLIGAGQHEGNMFMALELANRGTLRDYLRESRRPDGDGQVSTLSSPQLLQFAREVAEGMQQIAKKGIIHRDLSAKNVLVMEEGSSPVCKVSDYGLPRMVKAEKRRVPNRWMAPESLTSNTYTTKTDVWSYGVVLWEITTLGGTPYSELESEDLITQIPDGYKLKQPTNCHEQMYILIRHCCRDDPETRPTFPQLAETLKEMQENDSETYIDVHGGDDFEYEPAEPDKDDD